MKKYRLAMALAAALVALTLILVPGISTIAAADQSPTKIQIYLFKVEPLSDQLQLSWTLIDENNMFVSTGGSASLTITDNASGVVFQNTKSFTESDFTTIQTSSGPALGMMWNVSYSSLNLGANSGGNLQCTLTVTTNSGATSTVSVNTVVYSASPSSSSGTVESKAISPYDMEGMLGEGSIDAAVAYEPWTTDMVQRNIGKVMLRSADLWPNHPSYIMLMDDRWAQRNPDLAARTVRAQMDAERWINESLSNPNSTDYNHLIEVASNVSGFSSKVVTESLRHINFSAAITNQTEGYLANYSDGYVKEGLITQEMLEKHGYNSSQDFANGFTNLSYMELAQSVSPSSSIVGKISLGWASKNLFMLPCLIALDTSIWGGVSAFEKYGIQVTSPEPKGYNTSALVSRDLITGDVNVAYIAVCPAILSHIQYNAKSVMVSQVAAEGTALLVSKHISSIEELQGKIVATPGVVTIQHQFLHDIAEKYGWTVQEETVEDTTTNTTF